MCYTVNYGGGLALGAQPPKSADLPKGLQQKRDPKGKARIDHHRLVFSKTSQNSGRHGEPTVRVRIAHGGFRPLHGAPIPGQRLAADGDTPPTS